MICLYCCLLLFQSDQYICYAQPLEEIGESFVGEYNVYRKISIYLYAIACSKNTEIFEILIELAFFRNTWFLLNLTIAWLWLFPYWQHFAKRHRPNWHKTQSFFRNPWFFNFFFFNLTIACLWLFTSWNHFAQDKERRQTKQQTQQRKLKYDPCWTLLPNRRLVQVLAKGKKFEFLIQTPTM
jgi:hypothetical protein